MKFIIVGAGYLGVPTASILAEFNKKIDFYVLDYNKDLIKKWNNLNYPILEKDLNIYIENNINKNLFFTNDPEIYKDCDVIMIGVNTPGIKSDFSTLSEKTDLKYLFYCLDDILKYTKKDKEIIIIEKSTVPIGTCNEIRKYLTNSGKENFYLISNPEFLSEGQAIYDLLYPDRIIIGYEDNTPKNIKDIVRSFYNFISDDNIIYSNIYSSELSKLASNAMLAQKLTAINSFTGICEKLGGSINEISKMVGKDKRINNFYIKSSYGFGGSCLPKDLKSLIYIFYSLGLKVEAEYWEMVWKLNNSLNEKFYQMIITNSDKKGKILLLGLTFKPNTNDVRESPSISLLNKFDKNKYEIYCYDPKLNKENLEIYYKFEYSLNISKNIIYIDDFLDFIKKNEFLNIIIGTDWQVFLEIKNILILSKKKYTIFDGKLLFSANDIIDINKNNMINFHQIGNKFIE